MSTLFALAISFIISTSAFSSEMYLEQDDKNVKDHTIMIQCIRDTMEDRIISPDGNLQQWINRVDDCKGWGIFGIPVDETQFCDWSC